MKKELPEAEYIAELEVQLAKVSAERDNLQDVILKMSDELRNLRRMLFGRRSERFITEDPAQLKLSFEGEDELDEERGYETNKSKEPQPAAAPK